MIKTISEGLYTPLWCDPVYLSLSLSLSNTNTQATIKIADVTLSRSHTRTQRAKLSIWAVNRKYLN